MHKNVAKFEHKVGERVYQFFCDVDSPLGEAYDALSLFRNHIINMIKQTEEIEKKAKESAQSQESPL